MQIKFKGSFCTQMLTCKVAFRVEVISVLTKDVHQSVRIVLLRFSYSEKQEKKIYCFEQKKLELLKQRQTQSEDQKGISDCCLILKWQVPYIIDAKILS